MGKKTALIRQELGRQRKMRHMKDTEGVVSPAELQIFIFTLPTSSQETLGPSPICPSDGLKVAGRAKESCRSRYY